MPPQTEQRLPDDGSVVVPSRTAAAPNDSELVELPVLDYAVGWYHPKPYFWHSFFVLFVCPPLGLLALVHSIRAMVRARSGQVAAADYHASHAAHWGIVGLVLGLIGWPILIAILCFAA